MTKNVVDLVTLFFIGSIIVLIVTHAPGFSQAAGAVFSGVNTMGKTLTGANVGNAAYGGAHSGTSHVVFA